VLWTTERRARWAEARQRVSSNARGVIHAATATHRAFLQGSNIRLFADEAKMPVGKGTATQSLSCNQYIVCSVRQNQQTMAQ
jgi:hypothetical protein